MSEKRPIDLIRDSAFSGTVGIDGEGILKEFLSIGHTLLMIKEDAIYKFQLADQLDPGRTNIDIPHVQQKLYSVGASSQVVGRILMTAKYLFEKGMLDPRFDKAMLLSAVLAFFDEVIAAVTVFEALIEEQDSSAALYEKQKSAGTTLLLPSIADIAGKAKSFIQRAEHAMQRLLALCQIFYRLPAGKAWFDSFVEAAKSAHSLEPAELDRIKSIAKFAKFLRNCRHCVEHRKDDQQVVISDFKLTANGQIEPPMIEIVHPDTPEPEVPLLIYMRDMLASLIGVGEGLMAFLASRHVHPGWEGKVTVADFAEHQRRHPHVRFYFAFNLNGALTPIG
ncbi:MAG TPA: hypothetical protein VK804_06470 [Bradyrhizobium sp.]|jgi:hypothetical protein|uniref:hypothetical protein n=1 Tax=Bradyrhizobium sp. TaxID=376 RepID=UPI002CE6CB78|nr:hypothetical protein [Bradyrhizobium sp.]HTB00103.1 hypothetical protein [Bradyrhizobium sp.]